MQSRVLEDALREDVGEVSEIGDEEDVGLDGAVDLLGLLRRRGGVASGSVAPSPFASERVDVPSSQTVTRTSRRNAIAGIRAVTPPESAAGGRGL